MHDLNRGPPMPAETEADEAELDAMWDHVLGAWEDLGRKNAMWSVLTNRAFASKAPSKEAVAKFDESGRGDRDHILAYLERSGRAPASFSSVAEYGCGIGRTTRWLAETFATVRALDISEPHLAQARERLEARGIANVNFIRVRRRSDLCQLIGVDLFVSIIVLQHNPPPVILDILERAFAGLNENGMACFQVPTYSINYAFEKAPYLRKALGKKKMEVHFVPQAAIFRLAERYGLSLLEVRQDACLGSSETAISNTFLFHKKPR